MERFFSILFSSLQKKWSFLLVLFIILSSNIFAQEGLTRTYSNLGYQSFLNKKYDDAAFWYNKAYEESLSIEGNSEWTIVSESNYGRMLILSGKISEGLKILEKTFSDSKTIYDTRDFMYAELLRMLAEGYSMSGEYEKSIDTYKKAIDILKNCTPENYSKDYPEDSNEQCVLYYVNGILDLGNVFQKHNDFDKAIDCLIEAREVMCKWVSDDEIVNNSDDKMVNTAWLVNSQLVELYFASAREYILDSNYEESIASYSKALTLMETIDNVLLCVLFEYEDILKAYIEYYSDKDIRLRNLLKRFVMIDMNDHSITAKLFGNDMNHQVSSVFNDCFRLAQFCDEYNNTDAGKYCMDKGLELFAKNHINSLNYADALWAYANWAQVSLGDYPMSLRYHKKRVDVISEQEERNDSLLASAIMAMEHLYGLFEGTQLNMNLPSAGRDFTEIKQLQNQWKSILNDMYCKLGQGYVDNVLMDSIYISYKNDGIELKKGDAYLKSRCLFSVMVNEIKIDIMEHNIIGIDSKIEQLIEKAETIPVIDVLTYALIEIADELNVEGYLAKSYELYTKILYSYYFSDLDNNAAESESFYIKMMELAYQMNDYSFIFDHVSLCSLSSKDYWDVNNCIDFKLLMSDLMASCYDYEKSLVYCLSAYEDYCQYRDSIHINTSEILLLSNIGLVYGQLNEYDEAEYYLLKAADLYNSLSNTNEGFINVPPYPLFLHIAELYYLKNEFDKSKDEFEQVLSMLNQWAPNLIDKPAYYLCDISIIQNDYESARKYMKSYIDVVIRRHTREMNYMISQQRNTYWHNFETFLSHVGYNALKANHNLDDMFFNAALFSKGLLLNYNNIIAENVNRSKNDGLKDAYDKYIQAMFKNDPFQNIYEHNFVQLYSDEFNEFKLVYWNDVQKCLGKKDCAIEFVESANPNGGFSCSAILLTKEMKSPMLVPLCSKPKLDSIAKESYHAYSNSNFYNLYDSIWGKLEPHIAEKENVFFSPYGNINQINIEVLSDSTGILFNEKHKVNRITSTRSLCTKLPKSRYTSIALFGGLQYDMDTTEMIMNSSVFQTDNFIVSRGFVSDTTIRTGWNYLPGTKMEIDSIKIQMEKQKLDVKIFEDSFGTEEAFKSLSGKHTSIIHIATHGFFFKNDEIQENVFFQNMDFERQPFQDNSLKRCGLIMAGGQRAWKGQPIPDKVEDGILLAEEIASMDLSGTDLVVLSACDTGLGEITSEGVFGLQRAFKMAGVQTLVMSLWKVDDNATSLMMQTFYEHLFSGKSKREAFKLAQATVKEKYPEPYYWASFIILD